MTARQRRNLARQTLYLVLIIVDKETKIGYDKYVSKETIKQ